MTVGEKVEQLGARFRWADEEKEAVRDLVVEILLSPTPPELLVENSPRAGVRDKERVGVFLIELGYSADDATWLVTISDENGVCTQTNGDEFEMRITFRECVATARTVLDSIKRHLNEVP